jgi:hypothetical protein
MEVLDSHSQVTELEYEGLRVAYLKADGTPAVARPDLFVRLGERVTIVECKGKHLLARYLADPKHEAVGVYCASRGFGYAVVTEAAELQKFLVP